MNNLVQFFGYFSIGGGSSTSSSSTPNGAQIDGKTMLQKAVKTEATLEKRQEKIEQHETKNDGEKEEQQQRQPKVDKAELLAQRRRMIGSKCQTFYRTDPLVVTRAHMQYIFDEDGNQYLDCISNVQHVGHCHPHVVHSISTQLSLSTCNIRFVSPVLTECAARLLATLPPAFDTILFCNSGSEANDLAMQMARDWSGHTDMIVLEHAYHGHITTAVQMSPYKFQNGANIKQPEWVHMAPTPDVYRGRYRLSDEEIQSKEKLHDAGQQYAQEVEQVLKKMHESGRQVAGFIAEALQSCGGQVIPPAGYFPAVAEAIHANGGLVIMDEVQTGFGRVGHTFWAHQLGDRDFVPDIVTMGKPMGNGYPVAAVATRKEIADKMCGRAEYFNTYGGNPVACAAVLSVLDVIDREQLLEHSQRMGEQFERELNALKSRHQCIGDIRGVGMFWGVDLVTDRDTRQPATELATKLCLKMRQQHGVLLNSDGPHSNILKFKPPLCFGESDLKMAVDALDNALSELANDAAN